MVRHKLTAKDYKSQVERAREAEGASNTRPRVALRSCGAGDAACNGKERRATPVRTIQQSLSALFLSTLKYENRIVKYGSDFQSLSRKLFSETCFVQTWI